MGIILNWIQSLKILNNLNGTHGLRTLQLSFRFSSTAQSQSDKMVAILKEKFPSASTIKVIDVSGGCGAMFEILVESSEFKGLPIVKQHRMINETLKNEIKEMHGLRIHTAVPDT